MEQSLETSGKAKRKKRNDTDFGREQGRQQGCPVSKVWSVPTQRVLSQRRVWWVERNEQQCARLVRKPTLLLIHGSNCRLFGLAHRTLQRCCACRQRAIRQCLRLGVIHTAPLSPCMSASEICIDLDAGSCTLTYGSACALFLTRNL